MTTETLTGIITGQDKEFGLSILKGHLVTVEKNVEIGLRQFNQDVNTDVDVFEMNWAIDILNCEGVYVQIPEETYPIKYLKQQRTKNAGKMLESKAAQNNPKLKEMAQAAYDKYTNVIDWLTK